MPKKRPPKKRKGKRKQPRVWSPPQDWTLHLWGLFGLNVVLGLLFSQVTSASTVRIVGAPEFERERLTKLAQTLDDRPYFLVDKEQVRTLALENRAVKRASYAANLFGRGVLELEYRRPVARFEDGTYLGADGTAFTWPGEAAVRVTIEPPDPPSDRNLSVFGSWQFGTAARMCENIGERLPEMDWRLVVSRSGYFSLVPAQGGTVEFGSEERFAEKLQTLVSLLRDDPKLLDNARRVNLTSDEAVIVR
jgi:hypothetical protein